MGRIGGCSAPSLATDPAHQRIRNLLQQQSRRQQLISLGGEARTALLPGDHPRRDWDRIVGHSPGPATGCIGFDRLCSLARVGIAQDDGVNIASSISSNPSLK
jgi:hypothetical protein